jgi:hypothetical protein
MKPLTLKEVEVLYAEFEKKAKEEHLAYLDKVAAEVSTDDSKLVNIFDSVRNLQFDNASVLPNGTFISFPEKDGKDLMMTKGVVIDNFMTFGGHTPTKIKIVVSQDGRVKILENGERFLCFKTDDAKFTIPTVGLASVQPKDIIIAFDGEKALYPSKVDYITVRGYGNSLIASTPAESSPVNDISVSVVRLDPLNQDSRLMNIFKGNMNQDEIYNGDRMFMKIAPLQDAKFLEVSYPEYIEKKSRELGMSPVKLSSILSQYDVVTTITTKTSEKDRNTVVCTDFDNTRVIKVKGVICDFLRDKSDLRAVEETSGEFNLAKTASAVDEITIKCLNPSMKVYDITIRYVDKSKQLLNKMSKDYKAVPEDGAKQILNILGFDRGQSAELLYKSRENGTVTQGIANSENVQKLLGGSVKNLSKDKVKSVMTRLVDPNSVRDAVLANVLGGLVVGAVTSHGGVGKSSENKARDVFSTARKFASESEALSVAFEKLAMEHQNKSLLEVAKLMATANQVNEKVAQTLNGEYFPKFADACLDIVAGKAKIEKVAFDLMELKTQQYIHNDHMINPNYIQGAIVQLDNMYKMANAIVDVAGYQEKRAELLNEEQPVEKTAMPEVLKAIAEKLRNKQPLTDEEKMMLIEMKDKLHRGAQGENVDGEVEQQVNPEPMNEANAETGNNQKEPIQQEDADDAQPNVEDNVEEENAEQQNPQEQNPQEQNVEEDDAEQQNPQQQNPQQQNFQEQNPQEQNVEEEVQEENNEVPTEQGEQMDEAAQMNTPQEQPQVQREQAIPTPPTMAVPEEPTDTHEVPTPIDEYHSEESSDGESGDPYDKYRLKKPEGNGQETQVETLANEILGSLMEKKAFDIGSIAKGLNQAAKAQGATVGALGGAAIGGIGGALGADKDHKAGGAIKGALGGAALGAGAGAVGGNYLANKGKKIFAAGAGAGFGAGTVAGAAATHAAHGGFEGVGKGLADKFDDFVSKIKHPQPSAAGNINPTAGEIVDNILTEKLAALESPNAEEKKKENGEISVNNSEDQDYLADIKCENCGYEGKPKHDGRCPSCGAIGGSKPTNPGPSKPEGNDYDASQEGEIANDIAREYDRANSLDVE